MGDPAAEEAVRRQISAHEELKVDAELPEISSRKT